MPPLLKVDCLVSLQFTARVKKLTETLHRPSSPNKWRKPSQPKHSQASDSGWTGGEMRVRGSTLKHAARKERNNFMHPLLFTIACLLHSPSLPWAMSMELQLQVQRVTGGQAGSGSVGGQVQLDCRRLGQLAVRGWAGGLRLSVGVGSPRSPQELGVLARFELPASDCCSGIMHGEPLLWWVLPQGSGVNTEGAHD